MIAIVAFIAIFIVTYQVYKTAQSTERNPLLWAGLAFAIGIGFQIVIPILFVAGMAIYYVLTGTPQDAVEGAVTIPATLISIVGLVLSIVGMVLVMKHVSKVKDDIDNTGSQPPPPPKFGSGF